MIFGKDGSPSDVPTAERPDEAKGAAERVVKRYANRKLYDTRASRYVTLAQIAELIRAGEEVRIVDNTTKEDLTDVTLAQIIFEEQKSSQKRQTNQTLRELISQRTETVLSSLREGPIGRLIPGVRDSSKDIERVGEAESAQTVEGVSAGAETEQEKAASPHEVAASRGVTNATADAEDVPKWSPRSGLALAKLTLEDFQQRMDERISALIPWADLERKVQALEKRVEELETQLVKKR
jgi:polyhydroxyalkanoate synthesis repressor PhaR